jgi:hypothetical protein
MRPMYKKTRVKTMKLSQKEYSSFYNILVYFYYCLLLYINDQN